MGGPERDPRLGKLPADWGTASVADLLVADRHPVEPRKNEEYREIGIRSHGKGIFHKDPIRGRDLGSKRVFWVKPHRLVFNIVFAWERAVAVTSEAESGMIASHRFPMFRPAADGTVDLDFIRRFLLSERGVRLLADASPGGAGRNRTLNQKFLAATPLPLPSYPEQRKIAAILSSVDEVIETTEAVIGSLQTLKKAMMQELLTRGLPGRHTRFKQTEIGAIPEEWEVMPLGEAGSWLSGGTPSKADETLWTGPIPWVSPKDMKVPHIGDAIDHVSEAAIGKGTKLAPPGSLLMVVRGMILAHTFPVAVATAPVAFNQDIKVLRPIEGFVPDFLLRWLEHSGPTILNRADVANHGTKRLPSELLFAYCAPKPRLEEQEEICEALGSCERRMETEARALAELRATKTALMSVLLTGELRVTADEEEDAA